jgi:hypothetical protein
MLPEGQKLQQKMDQAHKNLQKTQAEQDQVENQLEQACRKFEALQAFYAERGRPERPNSYLAKARRKMAMYQRRLERRKKARQKAEAWLARQQDRLTEWKAQKVLLEQRLKRFQAENAANPAPIQATFRLDAGFGSGENVALLIEMGYEVYTKPYGNWLAGVLTEMSAEQDNWQKVGANAEMMAWKGLRLEDFPYPLDLGCERFWTGDGYHYSGLLHFGQHPVTTDLPGWFHYYNARQIIEAGNKEGKQVFEIRHLKVRSRPALHLQEHFALFAANFVRFASKWLTEQCPQVPDGWKDSAHPCVKEQVKVGAHAPARIEWVGQDCLVRFEDRSVYAGRSLCVKRQIAIQLTLPMKFVVF